MSNLPREPKNGTRTHINFPGEAKCARTHQTFQRELYQNYTRTTQFGESSLSKFCNNRYDFPGDHTPRTDISKIASWSDAFDFCSRYLLWLLFLYDGIRLTTVEESINVNISKASLTWVIANRANTNSLFMNGIYLLFHRSCLGYRNVHRSRAKVMPKVIERNSCLF